MDIQALGCVKNKQAREALRIGCDERDKNHSNSPQTFRRQMVSFWNPRLIGSNSITEILAWFNLDGYVFEIMPFMNKNLFEILIQRDFKPFDVRFLFPLHLTRRPPRSAFFSDRWFRLSVKCTTVVSSIRTSSQVPSSPLLPPRKRHVLPFRRRSSRRQRHGPRMIACLPRRLGFSAGFQPSLPHRLRQRLHRQHA